MTRSALNALSALPHVNEESSEHNGYHIPKGSYLHANVGCILRDPAVYNSPSVFNPDRFLNEAQATPESAIAFGYGRRYILATSTILLICSLPCPRRVCPGKLLADHIN